MFLTLGRGTTTEMLVVPFFMPQRFSPQPRARNNHNKSDEPTFVPHLLGMARRFYQPQTPCYFMGYMQ